MSAGERHLSYEALVREALCFGWIDGQARGVDELRSSLLLTPRRSGSAWSRPNKIRIAELEAAGLLTPAGIAAIEAAKASGSWTLLDTVEAGIEPPEFRPPSTPTRPPGGTGMPSAVGPPGSAGVGCHRQATRDPKNSDRRDRPVVGAEPPAPVAATGSRPLFYFTVSNAPPTSRHSS